MYSVSFTYDHASYLTDFGAQRLASLSMTSVDAH